MIRLSGKQFMNKKNAYNSPLLSPQFPSFNPNEPCKVFITTTFGLLTKSIYIFCFCSEYDIIFLFPSYCSCFYLNHIIASHQCNNPFMYQGLFVFSLPQTLVTSDFSEAYYSFVLLSYPSQNLSNQDLFCEHVFNQLSFYPMKQAVLTKIVLHYGGSINCKKLQKRSSTSSFALSVDSSIYNDQTLQMKNHFRDLLPPTFTTFVLLCLVSLDSVSYIQSSPYSFYNLFSNPKASPTIRT